MTHYSPCKCDNLQEKGGLGILGFRQKRKDARSGKQLLGARIGTLPRTAAYVETIS